MRHLLGAQQFNRISRIFYKKNKIFRLLLFQISVSFVSDICRARLRYLSRSFQISVNCVSDIYSLRHVYPQIQLRISIDITSYIHRCNFVYPQMSFHISIDSCSGIITSRNFNLLFYNTIVVCIQMKTTKRSILQCFNLRAITSI